MIKPDVQLSLAPEHSSESSFHTPESKDKPVLYYWIFVVLLLLSITGIGHWATLEYYQDQEADPQSITIYESLRYLNDNSLYFSQAEHDVMKANIDAQLLLYPSIVFERESADEWAYKIAEVFLSWGIPKKIPTLQPTYESFLNPDYLGVAFLESNSSITLSNELDEVGQSVSVTAHEVVHVMFQHYIGWYNEYARHPEFSLSLGSRQHIEMQAQLFSLEALAQIAMNNEDSTTRFLANKAFWETLRHMTRHADAYLEYQRAVEAFPLLGLASPIVT